MHDESEGQVFDRFTELEPGVKTGLGNALNVRGVGAEYEAAAAFRGTDWEVRLRPNYIDADGKKSREYDLRAAVTAKAETTEGEPCLTTLTLAMEVKGVRYTPWVVLRAPKGILTPLESWVPVISGGLRQDDLAGIAATMRRNGHPLLEPGSATRGKKLHIDAGITEPLRPKNKPQGSRTELWLEASLAACKAAEHVASERMRRGEGAGSDPVGGRDWTGVLHVVQPVVVLDGMLVAAARSGEGDWDIERVPAAQIEFEFATERYSRRLYRVDVVAIDHLPHYIRVMEHLARALHDFNVARPR
ncbi:MAG: hypothetical protein AB7T63_17210 [Planctomycetota bacterium]